MKNLFSIMVFLISTVSLAEVGASVTCQMLSIGAPNGADGAATTVLAIAQGNLNEEGNLRLSAISNSGLTNFDVFIRTDAISMSLSAGKTKIANFYTKSAIVPAKTGIFASISANDSPDGKLILNCVWH